jgi:hypothetical protein
MRLLLRLSLIKMNVMKLIKLYLMPIAARSAPNNGRVKEAKVSSCTRSTGKALNGKAKRGTNRQANGDEKGEVRQAKRGNRYKVKRGDKRKNSDDDIKESRGEDKSGNVRGNGEGERRDWEVQPDK